MKEKEKKRNAFHRESTKGLANKRLRVQNSRDQIREYVPPPLIIIQATWIVDAHFLNNLNLIHVQFLIDNIIKTIFITPIRNCMC